MLAVLAAAVTAAPRRLLDVTCAGSAAGDAAALNAATAGSAEGDLIRIHGVCNISATVELAGGRDYVGDSKVGTVLRQAPGASLAAVAASVAWVRNYTWTDVPMRIAHLTIDGNAAQQPPGATTIGLAIRAWNSVAEDLKVMACPGDGIAVSSVGHGHQAGPNGRISDSFITGSGGNGVSNTGGTTDWNLLNNWIADSARAAVSMDSGAGWDISRNHIYGVGTHAIYVDACFATTIADNYIEGFSQGTVVPTAALPHYGIACTVQGGASSIINNNKVFMLGDSASNASEPGSLVYIGVPRVNYATGHLSVTGNVIRRATGATPADTGLSFSAGSHALYLLLESNSAMLGNGTALAPLGAGVTRAERI